MCSVIFDSFLVTLCFCMGFPSSSADKESACNAGGLGSISGSGRSAWEGVSFPLEYSWASLVAQLVKRIYLQCSISGLGRSPGEGNGYLLQYSCLENPMDREAWQATVHGVSKSQTWLKRLSMYRHACIYLHSLAPQRVTKK